MYSIDILHCIMHLYYIYYTQSWVIIISRNAYILFAIIRGILIFKVVAFYIIDMSKKSDIFHTLLCYVDYIEHNTWTGFHESIQCQSDNKLIGIDTGLLHETWSS